MKGVNKNENLFGKDGKEIEDGINYYIELDKNLEDHNKIKDAVGSYEEALSLLRVKAAKDSRISKLYIKTGELYQLSGDLETSLNSFQIAYDEAVILQDKFLQVDSLIKIAHNYLCKREVEAGIKFAERADEILKEIDYIEGRLEACLYWAWLHYIRKEHYKAREICNEGLRICENKYLLQKGKILNTLVELYRDMTSVEEHLKLLQEAYDCFEKTDYKRGMLGVINNITAVYAEKLQDYKKAAEYCEKLKKLCESSSYVEFMVIAYMNLGEMYFRALNYEKALFYFKEALHKPDGPFVENPMMYIYSYLCKISLKLNDLENAKQYFEEAEKEFNRYAHREATLINFYEAGASLNVELGRVEQAKVYIKQALTAVETIEGIVKWDVGLLYEKIRLKEARIRSEAADILHGMTYTLSKYKNSDEILDAVYEVAIELADKGFSDLANSFLREHSHLKPQSERVIMKAKSFELVKQENRELI